MQNSICLIINVKGLTSNLLEIKQLLYKENPLIVCMTETHVTEDIANCEITIPSTSSVTHIVDIQEEQLFM